MAEDKRGELLKQASEVIEQIDADNATWGNGLETFRADGEWEVHIPAPALHGETFVEWIMRVCQPPPVSEWPTAEEDNAERMAGQ